MKRYIISVPKGHIMLGSLIRNQFFKFRSVIDDNLFISFIDKTNWLTPKLYERARVRKRYSQNFSFWNLGLLSINMI